MRGHCQFRAMKYLHAIGQLESASEHLEQQYSPSLSRTDAVNHFQSRSLLLRLRFHLYNEVARRFPELKGTPLTQAEIDSVIQQMREHRALQGAA